MIWIKHLSNQQQKPFLAKTPCINALFANKLDSQSLLDLLLARTHDFAHPSQAVFNEAFPPHFQMEILTHRLVVQYTVEEGLPGLERHLPPCFMLQNPALG